MTIWFQEVVGCGYARWSIAETDDDHQQMSVSRGEDDYGSPRYYLHTTGQPHAVVPPEDWTESWN